MKDEMEFFLEFTWCVFVFSLLFRYYLSKMKLKL